MLERAVEDIRQGDKKETRRQIPINLDPDESEIPDARRFQEMLKASLAEMDQQMEEIKLIMEVSDDASKNNIDREEENRGVNDSQDERSDKRIGHKHPDEWDNDIHDGTRAQTSKESEKDSEGNEFGYYAE